MSQNNFSWLRKHIETIVSLLPQAHPSASVRIEAQSWREEWDKETAQLVLVSLLSSLDTGTVDEDAMERQLHDINVAVRRLVQWQEQENVLKMSDGIVARRSMRVRLSEDEEVDGVGTIGLVESDGIAWVDWDYGGGEWWSVKQLRAAW